MVQIDIPVAFGTAGVFAAAVEQGLKSERRSYFYQRALAVSLIFQLFLVVWLPVYLLIAHFGFQPRPGISSTDANIPISRGIPAVTLGGGGVGFGAHSLQEWWLDRDSETAIKRTLLIVLAHAGLVGR